MRIKLYIDKRPNKDGTFPVRISIHYAGHRHITTLGCSMTVSQFDALQYDFNGSGTKSTARHPRHSELLMMLRKLNDRLEWTEQKIRRGDTTIQEADIAAIVNEVKGKPSKDKKEHYLFTEMWVRFIESEKKKKDLSDSTVYSLYYFAKDVNNNFQSAVVDEMATKQWIQKFIDASVEKGLNNTTIRTKYRNLHWFLTWCYRNEYCGNEFMSYNFALKIIQTRDNLVLFLTLDEIERIRHTSLPPRLNPYRDFFLFQCYTGLRYSDVCRLRNVDIHGNMITIITKKTGIPLSNNLNKYAQEIVAKYHNRYGEFLFPNTPIGALERAIKQIGRLSGIEEPVTKVEYRNHRREQITVPKWQLLTSHVGRKSFVVNSLDMGLTATQVMSYTGHSSISAMEPYISISKKKKDAAMDVGDNATAASDTEIENIEREIKTLEKRLIALKSSIHNS